MYAKTVELLQYSNSIYRKSPPSSFEDPDLIYYLLSHPDRMAYVCLKTSSIVE